MIYLDNSATTKPCMAAVEAMTNALTEGWANPSALYTFGIDAARAMRNARHAVAAAMGADAVVGVRIASSSVMQNAAEVLCYGTAIRFNR